MASFVKSRPRVEMIAYYNQGSTFDIGYKPKSRSAYRNYITPLGR
jgi:hypothetical protein